ncbi:MAG TPA: SBBP repeat-containing protein [Bryobacteraceae bacterium]|nr:SBBP repeat-containing protein [Bryobacteraceae bacterium]
MFRSSCFLLLACAAAVFAASSGTAPDAALRQANTIAAGLPLRFEANRGQMDPAILYAARANGYRLLFGAAGPSIAVGSHRVGISLLHGNPAPRLEALDPLPTRTDYFVGNRSAWHTGIPTFARVRYDSVYPGIDLVYYGSQSQLEYDFVLAPGADPDAIRIRFQGADRLRVNAAGDLVIAAAGSEIVQRRPLVYQRDAAGGRHEVATAYRLLGRDTVGFRVAGYDRARQLVIDPVLTYCTYLGGSGTDRINAVKFHNGLLYLAGQTDTSDQPPTDGAWANNKQGITNITLAIVDTTKAPNYPVVYFAYIGGQSIDIPLGLDVDKNGVAYLTGTTTSTNFPMAGNAFQTTGAGPNTSSFVSVVDPKQYGGVSLVFSTFLSGTTGTDAGNGIAVGPNGHIYVIGTTRSTDFPVTANAYQSVLWGPQDTFLCEIDPAAGALIYSTYLGGEDEDDGRAILVDSNGLVYFAASTLSQQFPMAGQQYRGIPVGASDVIVGVMDTSQSGPESLVYATYFGGSGNEEVRGMAFDAKGNVVVTGYTLSTDFPVTRTAVQPNSAGNGDAFVAVFNPAAPFAGGLLYSTYLGGTGGDVGYGVAVDPANHIYVTGYTLSKNLPVSGTTVPQATWGGGTDLFVAKIDTGAAGMAGLMYSTYLGASNTYVPSGIAVGPDGTAYAVGYGGIGLPTSGNASQGGYAGGISDGFLAVIGSGSPSAASQPVTPPVTSYIPVRGKAPKHRPVTTREARHGCLAPAGHRGTEPCLEQ